jgi:hypothetical protein
VNRTSVTAMTEQLIERLKEDIEKCTTREDHIRTTARANEATLLLQELNQMFDTGSLEDSGA